MSQAQGLAMTATKPEIDLSAEQQAALGLRIALNSNLAGMSDADIWIYYQWMCARFEMDPWSHPFDLISGKEKKKERRELPNGAFEWEEKIYEVKKLYPNATFASQLADKKKYGFSPVKVEAETALIALGLKVARVSVEVVSPDGRKVYGEDFIDLMSGYNGKALSGDNLQNALKKAATRARRRGTLIMGGLALPSEQMAISGLGDIEQLPGEEDGSFTIEPVKEPLQIEEPKASVNAIPIAPAHQPEAMPRPATPAKSNSGKLQQAIIQTPEEQQVDGALIEFFSREDQKGSKNDAGARFFEGVWAHRPFTERRAEAERLGLIVEAELTEIESS